MALRIRTDGRIVCAAFDGPEQGDAYIDDFAHRRLSESGAIVTNDGGTTWVGRESPAVDRDRLVYELRTTIATLVVDLAIARGEWPYVNDSEVPCGICGELPGQRGCRCPGAGAHPVRGRWYPHPALRARAAPRPGITGAGPGAGGLPAAAGGGGGRERQERSANGWLTSLWRSSSP